MRPMTHALPGALAELLRGSPLSPGKVNVAWRAAVGSSIDRVSAVRLESHVLLVDTANAQWAREINRLSATVLARLQLFLGTDTVTRLEVRAKQA